MRASPLEPSAVRIETERLVLVLPGPAGAARVARFYVDNTAHLAPWEPPRPEGFSTEAGQVEKLADDLREAAADRSLRTFVFRRDEGPGGEVVGLVNLSQITRGPLQSCFLGYSLAASAQGKGYMVEAVGAVIRFAWDELALHRIQASYAPANERSAKVLKTLGFTVEG